MSKPVSLEDIQRFNQLLQESLEQADRQQLIACIRLLGTSLANIKMKYQLDDNNQAESLSQMVEAVEKGELNEEFNELTFKTIVECASAMAVARGDKEGEAQADSQESQDN